MSKIYRYQTYLRIELTTDVDISGALELKIRYKKPSGTTGEVEAAIENVQDGVLYYDIDADSSGNADFLDEVGIWKFWAYVMFSDGREARGETFSVRVYDETN